MNKKQLFSIALLLSVATAQVNAGQGLNPVELASASLDEAIAKRDAIGTFDFVGKKAADQAVQAASEAVQAADLAMQEAAKQAAEDNLKAQALAENSKLANRAKAAVDATTLTDVAGGYLSRVAADKVLSYVPGFRNDNYFGRTILSSATGIAGTYGTHLLAATKLGTYTLAGFSPVVVALKLGALGVLAYRNRKAVSAFVQDFKQSKRTWTGLGKFALRTTAKVATGAALGAWAYNGTQAFSPLTNFALKAAPYIMTKKAAGVAGVAAAVGLGGYVASKLFSQTPELPEFGPENKPKGWRDNNPAPAIRKLQAGVDYQLQGGKFLRPLVSMTDAEVAHYTAKHAAGRAK